MVKKYSCFGRSTLLLTVSEKFHTRKNCISRTAKHRIKQKKKDDPAKLAEISSYKKNEDVETHKNLEK